MDVKKKELADINSIKQNTSNKKEKNESKLEKLYTDTYRSKMPLYSDYVFHKVFGSETEESNAALIGLLNIILDRQDNPIISIAINNPIDLGNLPNDKETEMDIRAETSSGEILDIEMQVDNLKFFQNRTLFYAGRLVNSSLNKRQNYGMMKKSIVVAIINGKVFPKELGYHSIFDVREREKGTLLCDRLEMHFLQLAELDLNKSVEEMSRLERLGVYLAHAEDESYKDLIQEICGEEEEIIMAENIYRKVTQDQIDAARAEARYRYQLQYNTDMYWSKEEGREEGKAEEQRIIAKNFKVAGTPLDVIAQNTGLSIAEIEAL